jgi:predicted ferric reductase
MVAGGSTPPDSSHFTQQILQVVTVATAVAILAAAVAVPFIWESQTLWYKVGWDKTMLRLGQVTGMAALFFLFLQIVLAVRGKFLERLFSIALIVKLHRKNGVLVACLAPIHVVLVLVPEGIGNLPIGIKYWPEMVGGVLFWLILSVAITSHYREKLKLDYRRWRAVHKPLGYFAFVLVVVHVLFVSDVFESTLPQMSLLLLFAAVAVRGVAVKFLSKNA